VPVIYEDLEESGDAASFFEPAFSGNPTSAPSEIVFER
jgi:hypothetical protein